MKGNRHFSVIASIVLFLVLASENAMTQKSKNTLLGVEGKNIAGKSEVLSTFTYKGILKDSAGNPIVNSSKTIIFRLYDSPEFGNLLWETDQPVHTDKNGQFTAFLSIPENKSSTNYYLALQVDGDSKEMSPRQFVGEVVADGTNLPSNPLPAPDLIDAWETDGIALFPNPEFEEGRFAISQRIPEINKIFGDEEARTHVNLGTYNTTGFEGQNFLYITVGGGNLNVAGATGSTISGGQLNIVEGEDDIGKHGTISGGFSNLIKGRFGSVGGGMENKVEAQEGGTIGGGQGNFAGGGFGTIAGGQANQAVGDWSTVAGGESNEIDGEYSSVGGGSGNSIAGRFSSIPGGYQNSASGSYSFAAGVKARANYDNTFVWNDDPGSYFTSSGPNQFLIHAVGGVGIGTNEPSNEFSVDGNADISGNMGIGNVAPVEKLHIAGDNDIDAVTRISVKSEKDAIFRMHDFEDTRPINDPNPAEPCQYFDIAYGSSDGNLHLRGGYYHYLVGGDIMTLIDANGESIPGVSWGNVGIGNSAPTNKLSVNGNADFSGNVGIGTTSPEARLHVATNGIQVGSSSGLYSELVNNNVIFHRDSGASYISQHGAGSLGFVTNNDYNTVRMLIDEAGNVGIGTWNPAEKLHILGESGSDAVLKLDATGGDPEVEAMVLFNDYDDPSGNQSFEIAFDSGDRDLHFRAGYYHSGDEDIMTLLNDATGNVGIGTNQPMAKLDVKGEMIVGGDGVNGIIRINDLDNNEVATIGAGFDYAETFTTPYEELEPGTVMIIDPENPGNLCVSKNAYDKKVAGIVAGAHGLGSGVMLGQAGVDGDHPIALAGRVYCKVDAKYGAVKPGDLLTTSPTPGYAMVIKDYSEAQGSIIGKAMQALSDGENGLILVLVTLQ